MSKSRAAWLEPQEEMPEDLTGWLVEEWGFEPNKSYTRTLDAQGWWWFTQEVTDKLADSAALEAEVDARYQDQAGRKP